jgi:hypothetical protein
LYSENKIIHCLCEFYLKQKINITKEENQRRLLKDYVINDNKKDFILLANDIKETNVIKIILLNIGNSLDIC